MILQNSACNNVNCTYNRTFTPQTDEKNVLTTTNATLVAFFDVLENVNFEDYFVFLFYRSIFI
jgi:hypothetical protein